MNAIPLIASFALFCFSLTGPVGWPIAVFGAFVFGWNLALYYAAYKVKEASERVDPASEEHAA